MLKAGIEFLGEHPGYDLTEPAELGAALKSARAEDAKRRDLAMPGISGGQYDAVLTHLRVIQVKSYGTWIDELSTAREAHEIFEFDGTIESIPKAVRQ